MIGRCIALVAALAVLAAPLRAEVPLRAVTSPGGITAWLVETHEIPFVTLEVRFAGGTSLDAPQTAGAVNLMTALLEEGAGERDARGFAEAAETLAASLRFSAGRDSVTVSARMLTENRDAAVDLLRDALVAPRFDDDALERVRAQVLAGLDAARRDPQEIAGRLFDEMAFPGHPYAVPGEGRPETVAALDRAALMAAHQGAVTRDRVQVTAVGDITADQLGALVDHLLGDLPEAGLPLPGRAEVALAGGVTVEPFGGPQSVILFGHEGIGRDDPDFMAAFLVNEVMGGGRFSARLMTEVRARRGLTYGISSGLQSAAQADVIMGWVQTSNATVGQTIDVIRAEWARMGAEGLTGVELAAIQTYQTGAFPLRFDGNAQIARILAGLQAQRFDIDYVARRNDLIRAVTVEDANRAAARLFRPEALHFVVVGSPEGALGQ